MKASGKRIGVIFAIALTLSTGACGGPEVPAEPTWERDIRPLMEARCIRCHDSPGHRDPLVTGPVIVARAAATSFNFRTLADFTDDTAGYLRMAPALLRGPVAPYSRMPPPPAEVLEDWQIEMVEKWLNAPELR